MKILIVHPEGNINNNPNLFELAEVLCESGYEVDVLSQSYEIFIEVKISGWINKISEQHKMRYLFSPEISAVMESTGFSYVSGRQWMTGKPLGFDTWYACVVGLKK